MEKSGDSEGENQETRKIHLGDLGPGLGGLRASYHISVEIRDSETLAIIAHSGAGKTPFLNCLDGFCLPVAGEVCCDGWRISQMRP